MGFTAGVVEGMFLGPGRAAERAGRLQAEAAQAGVEEQRRQFDAILEMMMPSVEAGDIARQSQLALLGLSGPEAQAEAMAAFTDSPGQQFMRERQQRALLRNAAATGGLGGGNVLTALQQQAAGFAAQDFGNQFSRLAGLSGSGQAATGQLGQFGQTSASNIANLMQQQAAAQASGILGRSQAQSQGIGQLLGLGAMFFSDKRLKKSIKKIGRLGKFNIYSWIWRDTGQEDKGLLAQEVAETNPELVTMENGYLKVDYNQAIGVA